MLRAMALHKSGRLSSEFIRLFAEGGVASRPVLSKTFRSSSLRSALFRRSDVVTGRVSSAMGMVVGRKFSTQAAVEEETDMFCFQCEQAKLQKGCTEIGVCGKTPQVAALQDLLLYAMKGLAVYGYHARQQGVTIDQAVYELTMSSLFSTLTNVNFDPERFQRFISEAVECRDSLKAQYEAACAEKGIEALTFDYGHTNWAPSAHTLADIDALQSEARQAAVRSELEDYSADVHGVRQMIMYGLKGMASYARHAQLVGKSDNQLGQFVLETLRFLIDGDPEKRHDLNENLGMALKVGEMNIIGMKLLNEGHISRFGTPTPTSVNLKPTPGKAILVSGHDMNDMENILTKTEGTGINVYTHGEMLPAHSYPELHKYKHLVGHWGGAWQLQKFEWADFPGPVIVTTNCLVEPLKSYRDRLFTLNEVGWPGVKHTDTDLKGVIEEALACPGFSQEDAEKSKEPTITVGFGHDVIIANAGTVLKAVTDGELKRIFVIGGCDGRENKRSYFTKLAIGLPEDTLILTLGCGKFRFNRHPFGTLGTTGLPRLLDMGQCNDTYSAVVVAQALANALDTDVNSLPLSIALSWLEQKAVVVLLSLLSLGIRDIRIGPVLPAFITPTVLQVLVDKFNLSLVDTKHPELDAAKMMSE